MAPYRAAVEGVGVLQRAVDDGGVGEDDEAEAPWAAGELVAHDGGLGDLAVGGEVLAQLLLRRLPRDAADEELALVRLHLSASAPLRALACCGEEGRAELGISGCGRIWGVWRAEWFGLGIFYGGRVVGTGRTSRGTGGFRGAFGDNKAFPTRRNLSQREYVHGW